MEKRGAVGFGIQVFVRGQRVSWSWRRYQNSWYTAMRSFFSFSSVRASAAERRKSLMDGRVTSFQVPVGLTESWMHRNQRRMRVASWG